MDKFHAMAAQTSAAINSHPVASAAAAWGTSLIAFLQSSQQVASTLVALVTSLAALITAIMALRNAWRNRNKGQE